jgi:hypothetical protein
MRWMLVLLACVMGTAVISAPAPLFRPLCLPEAAYTTQGHVLRGHHGAVYSVAFLLQPS